MSGGGRRVVLLSGGVGGAKLAEGLCGVMDPHGLTVIGNTGDDIRLFGLHISPDLDIVTYTLADQVNRDSGWGLREETWQALHSVRALGGTSWFNLGDRDLGVHMYRTERLLAGAGLAQVTSEIARGFGVAAIVLPMCEAPVPTQVMTDEGEMHLQEYLVRRRCEPKVSAIRSHQIDSARPAPGVTEAIEAADVIVIAPSNPLISIGPILSVPGMREALAAARAPKIAVSPIVGGRALKGPLAKMLKELGETVCSATVAERYRGVATHFVVDAVDEAEVPEIERKGMSAHALPTVMDSDAAKRELAGALLSLADAG